MTGQQLIGGVQEIRLRELSEELGLPLSCTTHKEAKAVIYNAWKNAVPRACRQDDEGRAARKWLTRLTEAWHEVNRWTR